MPKDNLYERYKGCWVATGLKMYQQYHRTKINSYKHNENTTINDRLMREHIIMQGEEPILYIYLG